MFFLPPMILFFPLWHNPSHIYIFFFLCMPHGNNFLINPISSVCLPTQWRCQRRQVTGDAYVKRNVIIVELIGLHCFEFTIKWPLKSVFYVPGGADDNLIEGGEMKFVCKPGARNITVIFQPLLRYGYNVEHLSKRIAGWWNWTEV